MSLRRSARNLAKQASPETEPQTSANVKNTKKVTQPAKSIKKAKTGPVPATSPTATQTKSTNPTFAAPSLPATPLPKKRKAVSESPAKPPPFTPTPSGVGLITSVPKRAENDHPLESLAGLKPRPTEPHATNATLSTPGGSRVSAYTSSPLKPPTASQGEGNDDASPTKKRKAKEAVPPDVGVMRPPTSTVDTLLKDAEDFLCQVDPKLKGLVEKHHCKVFSPEGLREVVDPFTALSSGIIGQQVCQLFPNNINYNRTSPILLNDETTMATGLSKG